MTNRATTSPKTADKLLARRQEIAAKLDRLLAYAAQPDFDGTIGIECSFKDGVPGRLKSTLTHWGQKD